MAPLILHNVPDDELYVGDDGIQRPYALVFPQQDSHQPAGRPRRIVAESGSFGKSTRRSRSKTGTPVRREDPTIAAADKVFSSWIQSQNQSSAAAPTASSAVASTNPQRKQSLVAGPSSQPNLGATPGDDSATPKQSRFAHHHKQEPTEVVLRGYRSSSQQYAAVNRYEQIAGRICEDYPRDPPIENRRYKSELRDPALARRRALTPEERHKVNRADSGEHWVKVTFESADAADAAIYSSPQSVLGHLVYAEPYHGIPPARDEAVLDVSSSAGEGPIPDDHARSPFWKAARRRGGGAAAPPGLSRQPSGARHADDLQDSPPESHVSSRTADTTTVTVETTDSATMSASTLMNDVFGTGADFGAAVFGTGATGPTRTTGAVTEAEADSEFCRAIPSARKARLLPAEQALLPQPSYTQRVLNRIPFLRWFGGSMIGNEVPRTEAGEFDWDRASLYWKLICWLDYAFGLFGGEILNADKDD